MLNPIIFAIVNVASDTCQAKYVVVTDPLLSLCMLIQLECLAEDFCSFMLQSALSYTQEKLTSAFSSAQSLLTGDKKSAPQAEL